MRRRKRNGDGVPSKQNKQSKTGSIAEEKKRENNE